MFFAPRYRGKTIRPALIHAWLGSLALAATLASCQSPEAFRSREDAGAPDSGTGGDRMGMGGMAGALSSSGGTVGSGGVVGSGGEIGTGGAGGEGGGGTTTGSGGRGGAGSGGAGGAGGTGVGSGGSGSGGSGGGAAGAPGPGSGGAPLGGRGGDTGGRGGMSNGSGGATGGRGGGGGAGGAGGTTQKILSIDFGVGGQGAPAMTSTEVAGVKAVSRWNSAAGAQGSLSTSLTFADGGAVTGATVSWMAPSAASPSTGLYSVGVSNATGDGHMLNGYLDPSLSPSYTATITVSSLPAPFTTGGYDVYVYYMAQLNSGATRRYKLAIGSKVFTVSQSGPSPTTFSKHTQTADGGTTGDYVLFTNVTGASFTLTSAAVSASDNIMRAPINGIQIVWPSGS